MASRLNEQAHVPVDPLRQHRFGWQKVWQIFLYLLFALWWGGLTFYAVIVVPAATDAFGSTAQGFVTQRVTNAHNCLLVLMALCLVAENWVRPGRWLGVVTIGLVVAAGLLIFQHAQLSALMNFSERSVPESFYSEHAIYLWLTAVEWGLGIVVLVLLLQWND